MPFLLSGNAQCLLVGGGQCRVVGGSVVSLCGFSPSCRRGSPPPDSDHGAGVLVYPPRELVSAPSDYRSPVFSLLPFFYDSVGFPIFVRAEGNKPVLDNINMIAFL